MCLLLKGWHAHWSQQWRSLHTGRLSRCTLSSSWLAVSALAPSATGPAADVEACKPDLFPHTTARKHAPHADVTCALLDSRQQRQQQQHTCICKGRALSRPLPSARWACCTACRDTACAKRRGQPSRRSFGDTAPEPLFRTLCSISQVLVGAYSQCLRSSCLSVQSEAQAEVNALWSWISCSVQQALQQACSRSGLYVELATWRALLGSMGTRQCGRRPGRAASAPSFRAGSARLLAGLLSQPHDLSKWPLWSPAHT